MEENYKIYNDDMSYELLKDNGNLILFQGWSPVE